MAKTEGVPEWKFSESPLRLRSLTGPRFRVEVGAETLDLDHKDDEPKPDEPRQEKEEIFRRENPGPNVGAMLRARGEVLGSLESKGLGPDGVGELARWVADRKSADSLTIELRSSAITRRELGRLGRLADREGLEIEIHLRGDG